MDNQQEIPENQGMEPDADFMEISSVTDTPLSPVNAMEVHHHPDIHHKRKKFREYILEFIMIFLAVTLGFFAESLREHIAENNRAREYAIMLMEDVISDTIILHQQLLEYQENISSIDTLLHLRRIHRSKLEDFDFWYYSYPAFTASRISFNEATLQQIKNSGNLRYFHDLKLKEKVSEYDNVTRKYNLRMEIELNWLPIASGFYNSLFNYDVLTEVIDKFHQHVPYDSLRKMHYKFLIGSPQDVNRFLNFCDYRRNGVWQSRIINNIYPSLKTGRELILLLKKNYQFLDN